MVANFNRPQAAPPKTALENYDFSWLGQGYTIKVEHNVPDGDDPRERSNVSAEICKGSEPLDFEYSELITDERGQMIHGPEDLTDDLIIKAFDTLKGRFEKVAKAKQYLGTYPKPNLIVTPRPPVMRNSAGSMRP